MKCTRRASPCLRGRVVLSLCLSDDTPNFYVENKQEKRVNVTQESLTAALEEAAEVQRRANEAYVKQFGQWPAELEALAKKE